MLDTRWVILATALQLLGSTRYALAVLAGHARPNRVSFTLWAAAPLIAFAAQTAQGVGAPAVLTLAAGVGPLIVLSASILSRHGTVKITGFDLVCAAVSALALTVWLGLDNPAAAVIVAVVADAAAAVPTMLKAWRDPKSENVTFYVLVGLGAGITLLTVTSSAPSAWVFAAYILTLTTLLTLILAARSPRRAAP